MTFSNCELPIPLLGSPQQNIVHVLLIQIFNFKRFSKKINFQFEGNDFFTIEFHNNFEVKPTLIRTILGWVTS
jgi:hypothetical protein